MEADDEPPAGMLTRWGGGAHRGRVSLVEYGGSEIEVAEVANITARTLDHWLRGREREFETGLDLSSQNRAAG